MRCQQRDARSLLSGNGIPRREGAPLLAFSEATQVHARVHLKSETTKTLSCRRAGERQARGSL
jgi:hypothetical protein